MVKQNIEIDSIEDQWTKYFRYDTIYPDQVTGIRNFLDVLKQQGFHSLEGPCGTGKTLIGATGAVYAMRSGAYPKYTETCILTPNKQQLKQFIREMRGVNAERGSDIEPIKTVVMKGRKDMLPFAYTDLQPFDSGSFNNAVDRTRRNARKVIGFESEIPLDWPDHMNPPASAKYNFDWNTATQDDIERRKDSTYDPIRAKAVKTILEEKAENDRDYEKLVVNGIETPYPDIVPHTRHIVDEAQLEKDGLNQLPLNLQGKFDPFYVGFHAEGHPTFSFFDTEQYVFDKEELFQMGTSEGVCPHEAMSHFGSKADIILGNYMHLFDPQTRNLTVEKMGLFSETTITILDEAHRIEDKVRDMLSETLDIYTIDKTLSDLEMVKAYFTNNYTETPTPTPSSSKLEHIKEAEEEAKQINSSTKITDQEVKECIQLYEFIKQKLIEMSADYLNDELGQSWQKQVLNESVSDEEFPLSSPDFPDADDKLLRKVKSRFENGEERMRNALWVIKCVNEFFTELEDRGVHTREPQEVTIGEFCYNWIEKNNLDYHREIILSGNIKESINTEYPQWVEGWTPKFQLYNCIPTEELRDIFSEVGGGMLMSATLSPPEVFQEVVGVNNVPINNDDDETTEDEETGSTEEVRHSQSDQFKLRFPKENRKSIIADLPRFTSSNRQRMTQDPDQMSGTRLQYANTIIDILSTYGNVMICMPKYSEAKWAYKWAKSQTDKECYLDQSSTNDETSQKLEDFFNTENAAIFTSTRGTITEGVDYNGDRLHCCAVIGIPLIDTRPDRIDAVKHAYGQRINSDTGFNTAIKIPAVRKSRQAIGRVLRGTEEAGVRILVDERYGMTDWAGANQYLSDQEQDEFEIIQPDVITETIEQFWDQV